MASASLSLLLASQELARLHWWKRSFQGLGNRDQGTGDRQQDTDSRRQQTWFNRSPVPDLRCPVYGLGADSVLSTTARVKPTCRCWRPSGGCAGDRKVTDS